MTESLKIDAGDVKLNAVCEGEGPAVIFCHGMPGLWRSWRHQLPVLAAAGFKAVAFDQRGYGGSSRPSDLHAYDSHHTVADLLAIVDALDLEQAVFVGADFGAAQVYNLAIRHPERVRGLVGMACPFDFDFSGRGGDVGGAAPNPERPFARADMTPDDCFEALKQACGGYYYAQWYQAPGVAERALAIAPREFLKRLLWNLSASGQFMNPEDYPQSVSSYLDILLPAPPFPWSWMEEQEFDSWAQAFEHSDPLQTFIGGISAYRVATRNWEINGDYPAAKIHPPSLFIAGREDPVIDMVGEQAVALLRKVSTDLRGIALIADAGHLVQIEQAEACNAVLIEFLRCLD